MLLQQEKQQLLQVKLNEQENITLNDLSANRQQRKQLFGDNSVQAAKDRQVQVLKELEDKNDLITEVRGAGLLLGIKTKRKNTEVCKLLEKQRVLTIPASDNIIRLAPPLIVGKKEVDIAVSAIEKVLSKK